MRDIAVFTEEKITFEKCIEQLKNNFKKIDGNEHGIHIGKSPQSAQIDFDCIEKLGDCEPYEYPDNFKDRMTLNNPYVTIIEYHLSNVAKKLVENLITLYPDMLVYDDEDWLGPAKDYLKRNYEY